GRVFRAKCGRSRLYFPGIRHDFVMVARAQLHCRGSSGYEAVALSMFAILIAASLVEAAPAEPPPTPAQAVELTAAQVFVLSDRYRDQGRIADSEELLRALTLDPNPQIRAEARFRLGQSLMARGDH